MYCLFVFSPFCFLLNLNVQYLQRTVLVVCDGRSLYSLYPEGKEKCLVLSIHLFSFFNDKISFYFCDLFIVVMLSESL